MEKTRKAFVVLAAAVTAGQFGCGSSAKETADARAVDTAMLVDTAKPIDTAMSTDTGKAVDTSTPVDAAKPDVLADAAIPDVAPAKDTVFQADVPKVDTGAAQDLASVDASPADAYADTSTPRLDTGADAVKPDVVLVRDASVAPPDGPAPLIMPAGTAYDVLTLSDLA